MRPLTFLRVLFAPLWIVGLYIVIRIFVEGAPGLVLAISAVLVGIALNGSDGEAQQTQVGAALIRRDHPRPER